MNSRILELAGVLTETVETLSRHVMIINCIREKAYKIMETIIKEKGLGTLASQYSILHSFLFKSESIKVLKMLIKLGIDFSYQDYRILYVANYLGKKKFIKELVKAGADEKSILRHTLRVHIKNNHSSMTKELLDQGVELPEALSLATFHQRKEIVRTLLFDYGYDPNKDDAFRTALNTRDIGIIKMFLQTGKIKNINDYIGSIEFNELDDDASFVRLAEKYGYKSSMLFDEE